MRSKISLLSLSIASALGALAFIPLQSQAATSMEEALWSARPQPVKLEQLVLEDNEREAFGLPVPEKVLISDFRKTQDEDSSDTSTLSPKGEKKADSLPAAPDMKKSAKPRYSVNPQAKKNMPQLRWHVRAESIDEEKLLQDNTFITEFEVKSMPFMQYDNEDTTYNANSVSQEKGRTQFSLTTQAADNEQNRESEITVLSGSYANKKEKTENNKVASGQGVVGVSNTSTFLHMCNNTTQVFNIKKIKFFVQCEVLRKK